MLSVRSFIITVFFASSVAWSNENKEIKISPRTQEALTKLKLPGVKINLDIGDKFLEKDGTLSRKIMPDLLHLSVEGYTIWAESIEPTLKKLMQD